MATLIDEEIGRQEDDNVEQLDALASEEQPSEEDNVPDKYRNKSAAELVQMHQEAERMLGRQSGEVGELRKVVDEFVMSQSSSKEEPVDEDAVDAASAWIQPPDSAARMAGKSPDSETRTL